MQRIQLNYYPYMRQFYEPPVSAYVPTSLTLDNLSGSFRVLLYGVAASLVVFAFEYLVSAKNECANVVDIDIQV